MNEDDHLSADSFVTADVGQICSPQVSSIPEGKLSYKAFTW